MSALRRPSPRAALATLGAVSLVAVGGILADRWQKSERASAADLAIARAQAEEQCTRHEAVNYMGEARKSIERFMNMAQPGNPNNAVTAQLMAEKYQQNLLTEVGVVPHVLNAGVREMGVDRQNGGVTMVVPAGLGDEPMGNVVLLTPDRSKPKGGCFAMELTPRGQLVEASRPYQFATNMKPTSSHAGVAQDCNPAAQAELARKIQNLMTGSKI